MTSEIHISADGTAALQRRIAQLMAEAQTLKAQRDAARKWSHAWKAIAKEVAFHRVTCTWCGEAVYRSKEAIFDHISECEKHPINGLLRAVVGFRRIFCAANASKRRYRHEAEYWHDRWARISEDDGYSATDDTQGAA